jgi:Putative zinc-finger
MKCAAVRPKLAGYLDDAITGVSQVRERAFVREHLENCASCREELQRFRKLAVLLSRVPRNAPPADLAVRIRVAAAQAAATPDLRSRLRRFRDRLEVKLENAFRPITLPATGGFASAILVFVVVLQLIVPGITVRAVQNDVPINILQPAELISLSDYPEAWAPEQHDSELSLPHGLLLDVTVDAHGQMAGYQILSGPKSIDLRHQLDQMLLFSRFRPMLSFGRPTAGGHVILSFSAVHVRG